MREFSVNFKNAMKQAEAEVVPSSSFVEVEVKAGVDVEVEVDATLIFRHTGCLKKNAPLWFLLISLVRNMLEGWYIFHFERWDP